MENPWWMLTLCCGWHVLFGGVVWWITRHGLRIPFTDISITIGRGRKRDEV